uniref:Leishmanolysin-like peptidase n=1 Tax=Rhizophora mucronata TaxID=61149 RepID=A0A2P2MAR1_RHIMU
MSFSLCVSVSYVHCHCSCLTSSNFSLKKRNASAFHFRRRASDCSGCTGRSEIRWPFDGIGAVLCRSFGHFMEVVTRCSSCPVPRFVTKFRLALVFFEIAVILLYPQVAIAEIQGHKLPWQGTERGGEKVASHSCIHDQIIEQRRRSSRKVYSVTPQVYDQSKILEPIHRKGRELLGTSESPVQQTDTKQPIRIFLNYDAVGHSPDRDCRNVGDIVKLGEPPVNSFSGTPSCNPHGDPPIYGDCWYNCTLDDISGEDKRHRLHKALGQTADWFRRALAVEPVKGYLRLSGYSACGQDGGVQLPREYVEEGVADADLVLLVTTRPTTGNTLAWAVACERDQWGRAIAGHVNVAPRHLTAEAETLLSATLIHEVMHVLGFDPHAFAHFRDERKRRRSQVTEQVMSDKLGRMVTRVVLPRVLMHSRHHYGVIVMFINFIHKMFDSTVSWAVFLDLIFQC